MWLTKTAVAVAASVPAITLGGAAGAAAPALADYGPGNIYQAEISSTLTDPQGGCARLWLALSPTRNHLQRHRRLRRLRPRPRFRRGQGRVTWTNDDGTDAGQVFRVSGNYLTLDRPHRLAFTWSCSTWPDPTVQTIVTVTIDPDGADASIMTIEHTLLPPTLIQQHAHGWGTIALQLEAALATTHPAHRPASRPQERPVSRNGQSARRRRP